MSHRPIIYVIPDESTGCWNWQGQVDGYGHPCMTVKGRICRARYVYYERAKGVRPSKLYHVSPDNVRCVNPDHMVTVRVEDSSNSARRIAFLKSALESHGLSDDDRKIISQKINELEALAMKGVTTGR